MPTATLVNTVEPLALLLSELAVLLGSLSDDQYVASTGKAFKGSTVGGHVRHCLDHVTAMLAAAAGGCIHYDHRRRGTAVETDRAAAIAELEALHDRVRAISPDSFDAPVRVALTLSADAEPHEVASSLGRELAFVVSHTIHHNAIIGAMVRNLGIEPPGTFGYAPSTTRYLKQQSCAR